MTSGIPTYDATAGWNADYANDPLAQSTPDQLLSYVYPTITPAPAAWKYSNTNYILAQRIIETVSPLHSYAAELNALISTLGLSNTYYQPYFSPPSVMQRLVFGYYVNTDPPVLTKLLGRETSTFSLGWAQAAGAMVSTPDDLVNWVRMLFEGNVLGATQLTELTTVVPISSAVPTDETPADAAGFGLGVFHLTDPKLGTFWGYQGSTIGYRAAYAYYPASGLIICIFTNSQPAEGVGTVNTVLFQTVYQTLAAAGKV